MRSFAPRLLNALVVLCLLALTQAATHTTHTRRSKTARSLQQRAPNLAVNFCETVALRVNTNLGVTGVAEVDAPLGINECLCIQGNVGTAGITLASQDKLNADVQAVAKTNTVLSALLYPLTGSAKVSLSQVQADVLRLALLTLRGDAPKNGNTTPGCTYPSTDPNFGEPTCPSSSCGYTCASGYKPCGSIGCYLNSDTCPTSAPGRRANVPACPVGYTLCPVPGAKKYSRAFECVDTLTTLDSCGGCAFPVPGGISGEDCSAIEGVADVKCINGGCQALSCMRGFELSGKTCVPAQTKSFFDSLRIQSD